MCTRHFNASPPPQEAAGATRVLQLEASICSTAARLNPLPPRSSQRTRASPAPDPSLVPLRRRARGQQREHEHTQRSRTLQSGSNTLRVPPNTAKLALPVTATTDNPVK